MNSIALMLPVLPNKREQLFQFAAVLKGERAAEYVASQQTVTSETWYLQATPMGDFLLVHFEAPDCRGVLGALATSTEPFDAWFRQQAQEITGIDFSQPTGPLAEVVFEYRKA